LWSIPQGSVGTVPYIANLAQGAIEGLKRLGGWSIPLDEATMALHARGEETTDATPAICGAEGLCSQMETPLRASPFSAAAALAAAHGHLVDARCALGERRRQALLFARFALDDAREAADGDVELRASVVDDSAAVDAGASAPMGGAP
jgi:hypothetical protein